MRKIYLPCLFLAILVLAACGGTANDPSFEVDAVVTKGVIEKFGSIFVNGVEFKTAGATLHLRDDKTDKLLQTEAEVQDLLKKGMVVTVKGVVNRNGATGTAQEVEFRNTLEAKIDPGGIGADFLIVLGQKIIVDDSVKALLATLQPGDVVEISGLPDDKGQIKATHLERKVNITEFEAKGFVKLIAGSSSSFTLLLSPNAPSGITVNLAAGVALPAEGSFIEVKTTTAAGGVITATSLEAEIELKPAENQKVSIEGFPASGTADDFVLNGQRVQTNAQTVFVDGIKANFALARKLEAKGTVVGGILIAEKITFKVVNGGLSKGKIEKFAGGLFVNGVQFKTIGAKLHLRDDKTTPDRVLQSETEIETLLKSGMVVTVKGGFDNNGTTGLAQEIEFRNTLEGKIDDKGVDSITIMGQKIVLDDPAKLTGLAVGDKVGISGLPDDRGLITATHIEKNNLLTEFEAKGFISGLSGNTFTLLLDKNATTGIAVTLGSGVALPVGAANGSFVEVRTLAAVAGAVTATKVELEDVLEAAENEKKQNEGFVTKLIAPDDFIVNGQQVHLTATTLFVGGIKADLAVGMKVEAEGNMVGGIINATKVEFQDNIRIDALVESVNAATATTQANLTLLGKKVIITSATDMRGLNGATLDLATVTAGQELLIRGNLAANGSDIIASRLDLVDLAPDPLKFRPFLRGPVTAKDAAAGTLTIAGITANTGTRFVDNKVPTPTTLTKADFFNAITENVTAVKVTWDPGVATSAPVREAELEI
ncbi:MAG: hypothetical protein FD174_2025 [Geobacteraceae bacterium]|nr:MAG: hypothetical protein FD174_2025 [Geobacteraceae bacterium]